MSTTAEQKVGNITVRQDGQGAWRVFEEGFEKSLAEFADVETAEKYALRFAESKEAWKVDIYDGSRKLVATYNSEDDAMPKPPLT